jgi:hypothetical protein
MDIQGIIERATTVQVIMDALKRRVQGRPGHQNAKPPELLAKAQNALEDISYLLAESDNAL